jgi:hypothetical protein
MKRFNFLRSYLTQRIYLELRFGSIKNWAKRGSGTLPNRWMFLT